MSDLLQLAALCGVLWGGLKLGLAQLKLLLKEEFATKQDFRRMELKLDRALGQRPLTKVKHYSREERAEDNG